MSKCAFCRKEEILPFECPFCGNKFCIIHRLPENHSCNHAPVRTPLGHWKAKKRALEVRKAKKLSESPIITETDYCPSCHSNRKQTVTFGKEFEIFECLTCGFKWKVPEIKKRKKKRFGIF